MYTSISGFVAPQRRLSEAKKTTVFRNKTARKRGRQEFRKMLKQHKRAVRGQRSFQ